MHNRWFSLAVKIDILLALVGAGCFVAFHFAGHPLSPVAFFASLAVVIIVGHFILHYKILSPLVDFAEMADNVLDGDLTQKVDALEFGALKEIQGSFSKMLQSFIESREAIENYMKTISEINKELESRVDSLSVLYSASKTMGTTLSVDVLVRNLLTLFTERLNIKGAVIMLYNERTDLVSVKDLLGFSPELFAKFRFYSDHKIVTSAFSSDGCWEPTEDDLKLLRAEFEHETIDEIRMIIPMKIKDHFVGLVFMGTRNDGRAATPSDKELIQALVGLASTAINNSMLYEKSESTKNELDRKVFNLMTLQQSGKVLSSTLNLDELIKISIDMFLETVWANKGVLMLNAEDKPEMLVMAHKGIAPEELLELEKDPSEAWAMTTLQKERRAILAQDLATASVYQSYSTINRSLPFAVYVPLLKEGELYGVVKIGAKINGEPFSESDLEFFSTLASQAVIAFENARLYSLAITDSITKLYVHRYFQLRLDEEVKRSRRYNSTLTLLMCDIDHFKEINDQYGHQQGDIILKEISQILRKNIRSTDIAARYGGEEFVIILPETTQSDARIVAERIRRDISKHEFPAIAAGQPPVRTTISIGVAGFPLNANDKDELIQKADSSMYQAKGMGRNRVVLCGID